MNEVTKDFSAPSHDITSFPDFVFASMAQRGIGTVEVESSGTDSVRQPPTRWAFRHKINGVDEIIAEPKPPHFRTILARFARVCGISPYGGEAAFTRGAHHYSIILRNSQQTGFGICINLHAVDNSPQISRSHSDNPSP